MNEDILKLEPSPIWKNFSALNSVPRGSKKEERVIEFMLAFGKQLGLDTQKDAVGNVLIKKPASAGMENRKTIVLQSHLDMVWQKNSDVHFDFDTEGIKMKIEDGFVRAEGTTLGADNGIGVSSIMSILESKDIAHPALECLFTIDEETGMTGAKGLQKGWLSGEILLNLDTEEDDELDIGCAGGLDVTGSCAIESETTPANYSTYKITIKGLQGGHSGIDIHKGRANANKIMARFLFALRDNAVINSLDGGSLRNAIPRECNAVISSDSKDVVNIFDALKSEIMDEFKSIESGMNIELQNTDLETSCLSLAQSRKIINTLQGLFNGVYRWSPEIADLVEASNNVARIETKDGRVNILCLTRSSVESTKLEVANTLRATMELGGLSVEFSGDYPGWKPDRHSEILELMEKVYKEVFQKEAKVVACHAGLECGLIGAVNPKMQMISFGPNIYGAHSPDERVEIASVQKFWSYLLKILEAIPTK